MTTSSAKPKKKHKVWQIILVSVSAFFVVVASSFLIYAAFYYHASDVSSSLKSDDQVTVKQEGNISFIPQNPKAGFVFYPGAKVEEKAYAPLCHSLAEKGVYTILIKMPFHLAFFGIHKAQGIPEDHKEITSWYLGGHSLGGAMAASFLGKGNYGYAGLALLGSYSTADLSKSGLKTTTLYGSEDKVLNQTSYANNLKNLPSANIETVIEGGNHSGYAYYGPQKGDGTATISKDEQISFTSAALVTWMGI